MDKLIQRLFFLVIMTTPFWSLEAQELSGQEVVDKMMEQVGGKEVWAGIKSLYAKEHVWFSALGEERVTQDVWRDMEAPGNRIELRSNSLDRVRAWTKEQGWGILESGRQYDYSEERLKNESRFWTKDIYMVYHRMAKEDSALTYSYEDNILQVLENGEAIGRIVLNTNFQVTKWTSLGEGGNVEYMYGPLVSFGPFKMPKWGAQTDGSFRFEYISIKGSEEPPEVSFYPPVEKLRQILTYKWLKKTTDTQKNEFLELFKALPGAIEGVGELQIKELIGSTDRHDVIIELSFESDNVLMHYQQHSLHKQIEAAAEKLTKTFYYMRYR